MIGNSESTRDIGKPTSATAKPPPMTIMIAGGSMNPARFTVPWPSSPM